MGAEPHYFRIGYPDGTEGFALAAGSRSRWPVIGRWRDVLTLNTPPILPEGKPVREALALLWRYARANGFAKIWCSSFADPRPEETASLREEGFHLSPRLEFRVPLGPDFDAALSRMSSGHSRNIRKGMSADFIMVEDSSIGGALELRTMQDDTFSRRRSIGNLGFEEWQRDTVKRVMGSYLDSGAIRFWFAALEGRRLSGVGILLFGDKAYYLVGGTMREGYECRAAFALFGHLIKWLGENGYSELNLGGTSVEAEGDDHPDRGLFRFKAGFGSEVLLCHHTMIRR